MIRQPRSKCTLIKMSLVPVVVELAEGLGVPTLGRFGLLDTSMAKVENLSLEHLFAKTQVAVLFLISLTLE